MKYFFAVLAAGTVLAMASVARAGECGSDPVYEMETYGVTVMGSRVRSVACMEGSEVLTVLEGGAKVHVVGKTDGWYKVALEDGKTGWVGSGLIRLDAAANSASVELKPKTETAPAADTGLLERLKGRIALQVEDHGEAYYVSGDGYAFYLKDGSAAYRLMRDLGLGISNGDFDRLQKGDAGLKKRLLGKILLKVQAAGEAYYVSPKDGDLHYLKDGSAAYEIMRKQGIGVTTKDLKKVEKKEVQSYLKEKKRAQKEEMKKKEEAKKAEKEKTVASGGGVIELAVAQKEGKVVLEWKVSGMETPLGFKVVKGKEENPVYPGNDYHYLSDASVRRDEWKGLSTGVYYFRVCEYLGGACGVYSNNVKAEVEAAKEAKEAKEDGAAPHSGSIELAAQKTDTGVSLSWKVTGFNSEKGFKVVKDDEPLPEYPGDDYHYYDSSERRTDEWTKLESGKTYYFRVCEYLGGKCGVYSNEVSVSW